MKEISKELKGAHQHPRQRTEAFMSCQGRRTGLCQRKGENGSCNNTTNIRRCGRTWQICVSANSLFLMERQRNEMEQDWEMRPEKAAETNS